MHVPVGPVGDVIDGGLRRRAGPAPGDRGRRGAAGRPGGVASRPTAAPTRSSCREHRIAPQRAWAATVAIGLGAALARRRAGHDRGRAAGRARRWSRPSPAACGYEFGWRTQLRPRLRWHAGGIAAVGFRGPDRQPWATDSAVVHDDAGTVLLTAGESVLTVPVPPPWPSPDSQRNADELVAALRDARNRSFAISPLPPPPAIEVPRRPWALYVAWLASVGVTLLILLPTKI